GLRRSHHDLRRRRARRHRQRHRQLCRRGRARSLHCLVRCAGVAGLHHRRRLPGADRRAGAAPARPERRPCRRSPLMTAHRLQRLALPLVGLLVFVAPSVFGGGSSVYSAAVLIAIFAVMAYGLDVIVSDLGEVSLAHTVFFAVGSYTAAWLSTKAGAGAWLTLAASIG